MEMMQKRLERCIKRKSLGNVEKSLSCYELEHGMEGTNHIDTEVHDEVKANNVKVILIFV